MAVRVDEWRRWSGEVWLYKHKSYGLSEFGMTYNGNVIPRFLIWHYLSVGMTLTGNVIPGSERGEGEKRYDFFRESHAAFARLTEHARSGMTFNKKVIPTEINRI